MTYARRAQAACQNSVSPPTAVRPPSPAFPPPGQGRRLFVFIVGGVSYSEMRSVHRLSARLGRDVFLGGTSVETPARFLRHVGELSAPAGGAGGGGLRGGSRVSRSAGRALVASG